MVIGGESDEPPSAESHRLDGADVAGIGQSDGIVHVQGDAGDEVEGLLRSVGDEHLLHPGPVARRHPFPETGVTFCG